MSDAQAVIGVDVGGTGTKAAVATGGGDILARVERPTDPTAASKGIVAIVEELLAKASGLGVRVEAIGVGAAGFVNRTEGSITFSPNVVYDDPQLAVALHSRTGLPIAVDNDANAAAWGERRYGAARGVDNLALLTLGTGIGSGFVVDGRLLRGATGAAAEIGHTVVDLSGPRCACGLQGCLEQLASGTAIARMAQEAARLDDDTSILLFAGTIEQIDASHVAKAARERDELAGSILRRAGRALGIGLSNVANLFDPEAIVLSGGVIRAGEPYLGAARDQLVAMTTAQRRRPVRLDVTTLGGDAGILGAAALAFDEARPA